jgi:arginine utilization protein RocB
MDKLRELKLIVEEQKFNQTIRNKSYNFSNIIAYNKNTSSKYILLGAHIDTYQLDNFEGAIDSSSSIAIILEFAKNLLILNPKYPLMIVFFDGE